MHNHPNWPIFFSGWLNHLSRIILHGDYMRIILDSINLTGIKNGFHHQQQDLSWDHQPTFMFFGPIDDPEVEPRQGDGWVSYGSCLSFFRVSQTHEHTKKGVFTNIWLVVWNIFYFPRNIGNVNHPNWRTHIFQRGGPTTNQTWLVYGWYMVNIWLIMGFHSHGDTE